MERRQVTSSDSSVWSLFTKKDQYTATCNTCNKDYCYKTLGNLKKHWKQMHGDLDEINREQNSNDSDGQHKQQKTSDLWSFFTKKDPFTATCNTCNKDYSYKTSMSYLKIHWEQKHRNVDHRKRDSNSVISVGEHLQVMSHVSPVWSLFTKKDRHIATCNTCHKDLTYNTGNLKRHWEQKHGNLDSRNRDSNSDDSDGEHEQQKPSVLWSLYTKKDPYTATCNTCNKDYSYKTSVNNLKRHWDQVHGNVNDIKLFSKRVKSPLWSLFTKKDRYTVTCNTCHKDYANRTSNLKRHWEQKHGDLDNIIKWDSKSNNSDGRHERVKSRVWSLFTIKDRYTVTCNTCHKDYANRISNLNRHWQQMHEKLVNIKQESNSDNSDEEYEQQKPSPLWSLFTKKDQFTATCNTCHNDYSYKTSITNLKKHWEQKHGDLEYVINRDSNSDNSDGDHENSFLKNKSNPTWKYYDVLDSDKFEANCKLCGESIPYETVSDLAKHVRDHGEEPRDTDDDDDDDLGEIIEVQETKKRRNNSKMWQYFSVIDGKAKLAVCIFCKKVFSYSGTITNLKRHLVRKHPQVKKMLVSTNGNIYVDAASQLVEDHEKDPIEMDTIYLEDLEESMEQIESPQITRKSPKKSFKRPFAEIAKEQVKNSSNHFYEEPVPKQTKPDTMGTIDYFGQYVVSLLKEMPKSAADQLQNEIILQIFTKKAALESQSSNKFSITVSNNQLCHSDEIITEPVTVTIRESDEVTEDNVNTEVDAVEHGKIIS